MSLDLDAIEQRSSAATPGPWWVVRDNADGFYGEDAYNVHGGENVAIAQGGPVEDGGPDVGACDRPDAEFIAHACEDVPALVAEVKRLREQVSGLEYLAEAVQGVLASASPDKCPLLLPITCHLAKQVTDGAS